MNPETLSRQGTIGQNSSNIDLIFTSIEMAHQIECGQTLDTQGSDHYPIEVNLDTEINAYGKQTKSLQKTNWEEVKIKYQTYYTKMKISIRNSL